MSVNGFAGDPLALFRLAECDPLGYSASQYVTRWRLVCIFLCKAKKNRCFAPVQPGGRPTVLRIYTTGKRNFVAVTRWRLVCIFAFGKNYCPAGTLPGRQPAPGRLDLFFRVSRVIKKKTDGISRLSFFGDPLETRTPDPLLKRQLLYRLS